MAWRFLLATHRVVTSTSMSTAIATPSRGVGTNYYRPAGYATQQPVIQRAGPNITDDYEREHERDGMTDI